jgi:carbamoyl-phosphate synthase small subunit
LLPLDTGGETMSDVKAALVLEDGTVFEGKSFGKIGQAFGETVFFTGVVGYQELITNPSYRGTLAVFTYPIIGCYGTNGEDDESPGAQVRGIIVREYSPYFSNWRATGSLADFLIERGIVGIREVDTRAVAVHLRDHGEMRGGIASGKFDVAQVVRRLRAAPSPFTEDLVREATWEGVRRPVGTERRRLVALNLGVTESLLAQLAVLGCSVELVRCTADADAILEREPHGVLVAGGPGDPRVADYAVRTVKALLGKTPVLGVGLGHQVLALALGCTVERMKIGHHGVNYPVRNLADGTSEITAQCHSFVVDGASLPKAVAITHRNLNDGTVEGIRSKAFRAASVQFHPCPDEMGRPHAVLAAFCAAPPAGGPRGRKPRRAPCKRSPRGRKPHA